MTSHTPIPNFPGLYPDIHHERIRAHFGERPAPEADRQALQQALAGLKCFYLLCFTNRCGSHYIAQSVASDQRLQAAGETLNADTVIKQSVERGFQSYERYLSWLIAHVDRGQGIVGAKASVGQFLELYNRGILSALGGRLRVVHIVRGSKLAQAVSLHIASVTQQWTSLQSAKPVEVPYSPATLVELMASLNRQNAAFEALFEAFGIEALKVPYEQFLKDPEQGTRRLGHFLGLRRARYLPEHVPYAKQADDRNAALIRRFKQDHALQAEAETPADA